MVALVCNKFKKPYQTNASLRLLALLWDGETKHFCALESGSDELLCTDDYLRSSESFSTI